MAVVELGRGPLSLRLSSRGGSILGFWIEDDDGARQPLMRAAAADDAGVLQSACFPLVPFGNRLGGNAFTAGTETVRLAPNTADPFYLHGDGWLGEWRISAEEKHRVEMTLLRDADTRSPYAYEARQTMELDGERLRLGLAGINRGAAALPFGLGWHPYFPATAGTLLSAPARRYWTERPDHLPDRPTDIPAELDFRESRPLPQHWVNNGFEDWTGEARILWPERGIGLAIKAEAPLRHYVLFRSDPDCDPDYRGDWFCFEPMSHLVNGHHMTGLGGLRMLGPGEELAAAMTLRVIRL